MKATIFHKVKVSHLGSQRPGEEKEVTRFNEAKKTKMLNTGVGILLKYTTTPRLFVALTKHLYIVLQILVTGTLVPLLPTLSQTTYC